MISTYSARIEVEAGRGEKSWMDVSRICSGYVAKLTFCPDYGGCYWLAHHKDEPKQMALIMAPSNQWAGDITREGWILDQCIQSTTSANVPAQPRPSA